MSDSVPNPEQIKQILQDMRKNQEIQVLHKDGSDCLHGEICEDVKIIPRFKDE